MSALVSVHLGECTIILTLSLNSAKITKITYLMRKQSKTETCYVFFRRGCANWQIFFAIWENQNKRNTTENFSTSFNTLGLEGTVAEKLVDNLHVEAKWRLKNASFKLDLHSVTSFSRISFTKFNGKSKIISLSLIFKILQIIIWS